MRSNQEILRKFPIQRIFLNEFVENEVSINSEEFKFIYRYLKRFEINFDEDVLLFIEVCPDTLISFLYDFMNLHQKYVLDNYYLNN